MLRHFSHIYVEHSINDTQHVKNILQRFPKAQIIPIDHYKDVFNRSNQDFRLQKKSMKLILAKKDAGFIYPTNEKVIPNFGADLFYSSSIINCLYDCRYCYLQGAYPSANMLCFTNIDDFIRAAIAKSSTQKISLAVSYDTDLLAFESIAGYCRAWIEGVRDQPNLEIEIRTKSANFRAIEGINPAANVILAWSLSPQAVIDQYEHHTPALHARLQSIKSAIQKGWQVRLCFDPVLWADNWQGHYTELIEQVFKEVNPDNIKDVYVDSFRMNRDQLKRIQKQHPNEPMLFYPFQQKDGVMQYRNDHQQEIKAYLKNSILSHLPPSKFF